MKRGNTMNMLFFIVMFWGVLIIVMMYFSQNIIESNEDLLQLYGEDPGFFERGALLIKIMTFQVTGVAWWIGLLIDIMTVLGIVAIIGVFRGVS